MKIPSINYALLHSGDSVDSDPLGLQLSHNRLSPRFRSSWRKMMQHNIISPCVPDIQDNNLGTWGHGTI
jgi:hypothetical protein